MLKYCILQLKKHQDRIFNVLDSKKISYEVVDISQNPKDKDFMREMAGDSKALPPQICNGDVYCGVSLTQYPAKVIIKYIDNVAP